MTSNVDHKCYQQVILTDMPYQTIRFFDKTIQFLHSVYLIHSQIGIRTVSYGLLFYSQIIPVLRPSRVI